MNYGSLDDRRKNSTNLIDGPHLTIHVRLRQGLRRACHAPVPTGLFLSHRLPAQTRLSLSQWRAVHRSSPPPQHCPDSFTRNWKLTGTLTFRQNQRQAQGKRRKRKQHTGSSASKSRARNGRTCKSKRGKSKRGKSKRGKKHPSPTCQASRSSTGSLLSSASFTY
jgi:hypothetical protein